MPKIRPISDVKVWERDEIQTHRLMDDSYQQDIAFSIALTGLGQLKVENSEYLRRKRN